MYCWREILLSKKFQTKEPNAIPMIIKMGEIMSYIYADDFFFLPVMVETKTGAKSRANILLLP